MPQRTFVVVPGLFALLAATACSSGGVSTDPVDPPIDEGVDEEALTLPVFSDDPSRADTEVVFQAKRVLDASGNLVSETTKGELTLSVWQRAARPWTHRNEPYAYHEQAWEKPLGNATEHGYRVVRTPNHAPLAKRKQGGPLQMGELVMEAAAGTEPVAVLLQLRDHPEWDIPLVPTSPYLSEEDRQIGRADREAAIKSRQAEFAQRAAPVVEQLEQLGGQPFGLGWGGGWILAKVPPEALAALAARTDLRRIDLAGGTAEGAQTQSNTAELGYDVNSAEGAAGPSAGAWRLGEGRMSYRMDADRFVTAGYNGESANPRHTYGDVVVGVNDIQGYEDEGCFLGDGASCSTSRVKKRLSCHGATEGQRCSEVSDIVDSDQPLPGQIVACTTDQDCQNATPAGMDWSGVTCVCTRPDPNTGECLTPLACPAGQPLKRCDCVGPTCARHGTSVLSIIAADYGGGQGDGAAVGIDSCPGGVCPQVSRTNKNWATGVAPEAGVALWGRHATCFERVIGPTAWCPAGATCERDLCRLDALANAFTQPTVGATSLDVDIMNNSWTLTDASQECKLAALSPVSIEAENAYDDGIFVVAAAGNDGAALTGCHARAPASLPKVFAVNGMPTACVGAGQSCTGATQAAANNQCCSNNLQSAGGNVCVGWAPAGTCGATPTAGTCSGGGTCGDDYKSCTVTGDPWRRGGADVTTPDGQLRPAAASIIDLVAPAGIRFATTELGPNGQINDNNPAGLNFGGTSAAAAVISGLAADVKSAYLARGETWINAPGRLHTVMLAMGDRHRDTATPGTTAQGTTRGDDKYGFGRVKLRRFGGASAAGAEGAAGRAWNTVLTPSSGTPAAPLTISTVPFATPLASGTALVKCVLLQQEDMSDQSTVSSVNLSVELQTPASSANGLCSGSDTVALSRTDDSFDVKSMVAVTSSDISLAGKCVKVNAIVRHRATPTITVHMMCYAAPVNDDAQLSDADDDGVADADETAHGTCVNASQTSCSGNCATAESTLAKTIDTDCDGVRDDEEITSTSNPTAADSDGDGTKDNNDSVQNASWAGVGSTCTTRAFADWTGLTGPRSTFDGLLGGAGRRSPATFAAADAVHVAYCADPGCKTVVTTADAGAGATSATPVGHVARGLNFVQASVKKGEEVACGAASRWQFLAGPLTSATASHQHTCAGSTSMRCWGAQGAEGRLGNDSTTGSAAPVVVAGVSSVWSMTSGEAHTCALRADETLKCWGANASGQLGIGNTQNRTTAADVGLSAVKAISGSSKGTCAIVGDTGTAKCWGYNADGQVGDGTTNTRKSPVDVKVGANPLTNVATIEAGNSHNCALLVDGTVKCWGYNADGRLGIGTTVTPITNPTDVLGLGPASGVIALTAGSAHTCVLTARGAVRCWGGNSHGQLGDGTTTSRTQPVDVIGLGSGVAALMTAGHDATHQCAVLHSGAMKCWGRNNRGQLGDGTTIDRWTAVDVQGLPASGASFAAVGAGSGVEGHTCAVRSDSLFCWGSNEKSGAPAAGGQLGIGSFTPSFSAQPLSALASGAAPWSDAPLGGGGFATQQVLGTTASFGGSWSSVATSICGIPWYYQGQVSGGVAYSQFVYPSGQKALTLMTTCAGGWHIYLASSCAC